MELGLARKQKQRRNKTNIKTTHEASKHVAKRQTNARVPLPGVLPLFCSLYRVFVCVLCRLFSFEECRTDASCYLA